ncbi:MaoC family dehydratase N-terminal domain-containing protein [Antrihabitans sp. YC2-6]|uniref:FAS1-like dehydratase domain-containing protein n=1 Tax=Antrihabitans sp. YC2-6 TaxID=2799498 RepID=UPI0018F31ACC|nr:MaoC family dehydratase N-terminal domain-containing protein [Antrihabitans sp. YC2-6]MBJ8344715.1 MaoC family dehydratase N-terminal domain-containing protein [Antrihabitans sp. YC2-6]
MVNAAAVGTVGSPFVVDLERGKIREFAHATQSANPDYWEGEKPIVPATFLTTQMFWQEWAGPEANPWESVELDQQRGMHAEQDFVFFGPPPRAGDRLIATSRIERIYEKAGARGGTLTLAEMITEFRDVHGRLVAEAWLTGVETDRNPAEAQR